VTDSAPEAYTSFVSGLLDAEAVRRTALEQKGAAIITTAGTLVTLLFGLVAVVTGKASFSLPGAAHGWLIAAVILFVIACFLGILTSVPVPYGETEITKDDLVDWWDQQQPIALIAISSARLKALTAARRINTIKAAIVAVATTTLVAALAMLATAIVEILD
jgi:hypothetical protein